MSPGGEYTRDITVADPEHSGEEDIVALFASSPDSGDEILVFCILKY